MQVKKNPEEIHIRYLKGVGPVKAALFARIGIESISDLFYYLPRRYEDRSNIVKISSLKPGEMQAVIGKVLKTGFFTAKTGTRIFEVSIGGEEGKVFAVWYNQRFMNDIFSVGQTVMLYGKVEVQKRLQISHPAFEITENEDFKKEDLLEVGRIVPIYPLTEKLNQRYMRRAMFQAIHLYHTQTIDSIPMRIRARHKLVDLSFAIENIHFPHSTENLEKAYRRLVFEEFFYLQVVMAVRRAKLKEKGTIHEVREGLIDEFSRLFPFEFTSEQKKCINEIEHDMSSEKVMSRLLQGDVGSGKTVVAMYAILLAVNNGYQATMMAPTEILARQHYLTVSRIFMPLGLNVRLIVSGIKQKARETIIKEIRQGEADIVIGTHSLISRSLEFNNLGLIVIDEQHKFGVEQRKILQSKGHHPDTLVMTATPIPRSLAMTVYGDMDLSLMKEKPAGREPVTTYWVEEERRERVYEFMRTELKKGRQAFIVCPRIKSTGLSELRSAEETYIRLKDDMFKNFRVAIMHGRLKTEEKDRIMSDFRDKKYDLLIATTVIEVGVDIPDVSVMLVEHAEQYGLSQLHQLRGRIGRGKHPSYCILMGEAKTDASNERISTMLETEDGFKIAEKDLDIRGPGEFLGIRQSGLPELRVGNVVRDFGIMEEAREEAFKLVSEDPELGDERNVDLKRSISERFRDVEVNLDGQ